jgi:hypothetical protein
MENVNLGWNVEIVLRPDFDGDTRLILNASLASWIPIQ